jgi:hypothetical protein
MKRNILFGSVLAAALSVGLAAQSPAGAPQDPTAPPSSPRPSPSAQAPSQKDDSSKTVTVTGCLKSDSASATGTSGTAAPAGGGAPAGGASSSKSEGSILANASTGSGSSTGAPGAAGTAGSSSSASQYKLSGGSKSDLTKYVNSKVEIKGKLDSASGAMSSSSSPTLQVDSVKQISPSCTE